MNNIDQNQLNRTIEGALEALWVKLIEDNKYATGAGLYGSISRQSELVGYVFSDWVDGRDFNWSHMVGDWK